MLNFGVFLSVVSLFVALNYFALLYGGMLAGSLNRYALPTYSAD